MVRTLVTILAVSLLTIGCRDVIPEYSLSARLIRTEVESSGPPQFGGQDLTATQLESRSSWRFSPHGEVWAGGWGLMLDYQESEGRTGKFQFGNGWRQFETEIKTAEGFLGHRFAIGEDLSFDLLGGLRDRRIRIAETDQRPARPPPPLHSDETLAQSEGVLGARLRGQLGPFVGTARADIGTSSKLRSWVLQFGVSYPVFRHLETELLYRWWDLDLDRETQADLKRRGQTVMLGLVFRF